MQQTSRISLYGGGLNSDDSRDIMPQFDGRVRWNIAYGDDGNGQDIVAVDGHREISLSSVIDEETYDYIGELLGSCSDIETNKIYYFVNLTSNNLTHILEFDTVTESISVVLKDVVYTDGIFRILDIREGSRVSAEVMDGKLFFTDGRQDPFKLNIQRAKNYTNFIANNPTVIFGYIPSPYTWTADPPIYFLSGSGMVVSGRYQDPVSYQSGQEYVVWDGDIVVDSYLFSPYFVGYQASWNKDQLTQIKPPCKDTLIAEYSNEAGFEGNFVSGKAFKFAVKYIYKDYEQSVWSASSNIPLDKTIDSTGESTDVYNCISLSIKMPNPDVKFVRVACCDASQNIWYVLDDIDVSDFRGLDRYTYKFFGNKLGVNIPLEEINESFHYVPLTSTDIELVSSRIVHSNISEGRDEPDISISVTPEEAPAGNSSLFATVDSITLVSEQSFSISPRGLANLKVKISAPSGWDYVPAVGELKFNIPAQNLLPNIFVDSDGIMSVSQMLTYLLNLINSKSYSISLGIYIRDTQAFVIDSENNTKTLCIVFGLRYFLHKEDVSGWNYISAGAFDFVSDGEFINTISGNDAFDSLTFDRQLARNSQYLVSIYSHFTANVSIGSNSNGTIYPTYKSGSVVSVGIGYYDHAMRYMPLNKTVDVFIPNRSSFDKRWQLKVDITGSMPDYADKYSVFQTESNIQDSCQVIFNPKGEAFLGGLTGDNQTINGEPSVAIENVYLTGVTLSNTNNGELYWVLMYNDGVPLFQLYKNSAGGASNLVGQTYREKHKKGLGGDNDWEIPGVFGSGSYRGTSIGSASLNAPSTLFDGNSLTLAAKSVIGNTGETSESSMGQSSAAGGIVKVYNDSDRNRALLRLKIVARNNSGIDGYVEVKTNLASVGISVNRKLLTELAQGVHLSGSDYTQDEIDRWRFNIASYLNVLKKYNSKDGYNVEVGDYIRVLSHNNTLVNDGVLLKITKMGEVITSADGYFQYAYVYTEKDTRATAYDFSGGGVIELLKVKQSNQTLFYSEVLLRGYSYNGNVKLHACDILTPTSGLPTQTIFVDAGNAYVRPRWLVKPTGDVDSFSYYVEDFRISDAFPSRTFAYGKMNLVDKSSRSRNHITGIRYGGSLLDNTLTNNTCVYKYDNVVYLDEKYGPISGMILNGDVLKVFQHSNVPSIYIGKAEMKMADGSSQWVVSDKFLAEKRPSSDNYGSSHIDSVIDVNGSIYFWDQRNGCPCKATSGGIFPLDGRVSNGVNATDLKMARAFEEISANIKSNPNSKVIASYSKKYRLVSFSFIIIDSDGYVQDSSYTISFHEPTGRWFSRYGFVLFSYDYVGIKTYALGFDIKDSPTLMPKILDVFASNVKVSFGVSSTELVGYFDGEYGVVEVNVNEPRRQRKLFDSISLDMSLGSNYIPTSTKANIITFTTPATATYKAQYSYLNQYQLVKEELNYVAPIPKDSNSFAGKPASYNMKVGNEMQGNYCTVTMYFPKVIYGASVPNYTLRAIDLTYSLFK